MRKLLALLLFAAPCFAQTPAPDPTPAATVSTFSVQSSVASLPILGQTVAANITGAALSITPNFSVTQTDLLSGSVQAYFGGESYGFSLDKVTAKTNLSAWHFRVHEDASIGVSEYNGQAISVMAGGRLMIQPPNQTKFQLAAGAYYLNARGVTGHVVVTLGPTISF